MDKQHVDIMLPLLSKYLHKRAVDSARQAMEQADQSACRELVNIPYKNPVLILLASIFWGHFGVDRFLMGDICTGIVKIVMLLIGVPLVSAGSVLIVNAEFASLGLALVVIGSLVSIALVAWWIVDIVTLHYKAYVWNYYRILDVCKITFFGDVRVSNPYIAYKVEVSKKEDIDLLK